MSFATCLLLTALISVTSACNFLSFLKPLPVRSAYSPYFVANMPAELVVELRSVLFTGSNGKNIGFILKGPSVSEIARGTCKLMNTSPVGAIGYFPKVTCRVPAMALGKYQLFLSADTSCGQRSFKEVAVAVEVIEPPHIVDIAPPHGPKHEQAKIKITGSNIGGSSVFCKFSFAAGEGAATAGNGSPLGCALSTSSFPASSVTSTSAECIVPPWPGPLLQCGGSEGCQPVPGAVCDQKVHVQLTNEAKVFSIEQSFYLYDETLGQKNAFLASVDEVRKPIE